MNKLFLWTDLGILIQHESALKDIYNFYISDTAMEHLKVIIKKDIKVSKNKSNKGDIK